MDLFEKLLPFFTLLGGWLLGLCTLYLSEAVVQHAKDRRFRRKHRDEISQLIQGMRRHGRAFVFETLGRKHVRIGDDPTHSMDFAAGKYLDCLYDLEKRGIVEMVGVAQGGGGVYVLTDTTQYQDHKRQQAQNVGASVTRCLDLGAEQPRLRGTPALREVAKPEARCDAAWSAIGSLFWRNVRVQPPQSSSPVRG